MQIVAKLKISVIVVMAVVLLGALAVLAVRLTGGHLVTIQDDSMTPVLKRGDLAIAADASLADMRNGNLIATPDPKNPDQIIAHRIVGTPTVLGQNNFQTQGDHSPSPETFVTADRILGMITYRIPYGGTVAQNLSWVMIPIAIAALTALLVGASALRAAWHRHRENHPYVLFGFNHRSHFHS